MKNIILLVFLLIGFGATAQVKGKLEDKGKETKKEAPVKSADDQLKSSPKPNRLKTKTDEIKSKPKTNSGSTNKTNTKEQPPKDKQPKSLPTSERPEKRQQTDGQKPPQHKKITLSIGSTTSITSNKTRLNNVTLPIFEESLLF